MIVQQSCYCKDARLYLPNAYIHAKFGVESSNGDRYIAQNVKNRFYLRPPSWIFVVGKCETRPVRMTHCYHRAKLEIYISRRSRDMTLPDLSVFFQGHLAVKVALNSQGLVSYVYKYRPYVYGTIVYLAPFGSGRL